MWTPCRRTDRPGVAWATVSERGSVYQAPADFKPSGQEVVEGVPVGFSPSGGVSRTSGPGQEPPTPHSANVRAHSQPAQGTCCDPAVSLAASSGWVELKCADALPPRGRSLLPCCHHRPGLRCPKLWFLATGIREYFRFPGRSLNSEK